MSCHRYIQSETFINSAAFFRTRRPWFEIQCRIVEAAAVIWATEAIWVYSFEFIALQSIYLQVEASITLSLTVQTVHRSFLSKKVIHFTKLNNLFSYLAVSYTFKILTVELWLFVKVGTFDTLKSFYISFHTILHCRATNEHSFQVSINFIFVLKSTDTFQFIALSDH